MGVDKLLGTDNTSGFSSIRVWWAVYSKTSGLVEVEQGFYLVSCCSLNGLGICMDTDGWSICSSSMMGCSHEIAVVLFGPWGRTWDSSWDGDLCPSCCGVAHGTGYIVTKLVTKIWGWVVCFIFSGVKFPTPCLLSCCCTKKLRLRVKTQVISASSIKIWTPNCGSSINQLCSFCLRTCFPPPACVRHTTSTSWTCIQWSKNDQ